MRFIFFILYFLIAKATFSQKILQLEMINHVESIKYYEGSKITFRVIGSDNWLERTIENIMIPEQTIIFNEGMYHINQIQAIRTKRWGVFALGAGLSSFGTAWTGLAILDELRKNDQSNIKDYVIGLTSILSGYTLNKLFFNKNNDTSSNRYRLRLLDLSMY
jgi:hypothetical protein